MKKIENNYAFEAVKLSRRIFKKLNDVEELLEAIAREIRRQLDRQAKS